MKSASEGKQPANLPIYQSNEVVAHYAGLEYLTACERLLFDTYLKSGMAILDLGVGGGRTTPYLSNLASSYIGIDYSEDMVRVCRSKYPELQFEVADAADLSRFADESFDAIVFSFNGIDYLAPDDKRQECLQECYRALKPGGVFIFSSHNPRSLFAGWGWDPEHLRNVAQKISGGRRLLFNLALPAITGVRAVLGLAQAWMRSLPRAYRRIPTQAFWRGEGYLLDPSHGGLLTHNSVPRCAIAELTRFRFKFLQKLPENYPLRGEGWSARWYYYVFSKE